MFVLIDLVPVAVKGKKKKGRESVTDKESIRTEDIEREYRKVLVQPGNHAIPSTLLGLRLYLF